MTLTEKQREYFRNYHREYRKNPEVLRRKHEQDKRYKERNPNFRKAHYNRNRAILLIAKGNICDDCGGEFMSRKLHFHHRDPSTKRYKVGALMSLSEKRIREEIVKCDVLCEECHRAIHRKLCGG